MQFFSVKGRRHRKHSSPLKVTKICSRILEIIKKVVKEELRRNTRSFTTHPFTHPSLASEASRQQHHPFHIPLQRRTCPTHISHNRLMLSSFHARLQRGWQEACDVTPFRGRHCPCRPRYLVGLFIETRGRWRNAGKSLLALRSLHDFPVSPCRKRAAFVNANTSCAQRRSSIGSSAAMLVDLDEVATFNR